MKIVIYGGAFNPPHVGHAIAIENVLRLFPCDEIWVMPTADRHDKKVGTPGKQRVAMLDLMVKEFFPYTATPIKISTMEIDRPKLTTTYETKQELESQFPGNEFHFLVGSDILGDIETKWHQGKELFNSGKFLAIQNATTPLPENPPKHVTLLDKDAIRVGISSTFVRGLLKKGSSGVPYISKGVADFIRVAGLYR